MTDKQLIKGCINGEKEYQKALFQKYAGKMLTVCRRYARHEMEAEDLLQDTFIKVFNNINKYNFKGSLEGWIRRIAINTALKNYKKHSVQKERIGLSEYDDRAVAPSAISKLSEEELLKLIAELPNGYKVVFNLYAIEGFSHKEIAAALDIQESTSRSQLVKARKLLQQKIINLQKIVL